MAWKFDLDILPKERAVLGLSYESGYLQDPLKVKDPQEFKEITIGILLIMFTFSWTINEEGAELL